jgi:type IV pilus assembly protein PilC
MPGIPGIPGRHASEPAVEARPERLDLIVFSRQMAIFVRSGMPILDGIRVVRQQALSGVFRKALEDVATRLEEGMPLWVALGRHPDVFFDLYVEMIRATEHSGNLDAMLDQLAGYLETSQASSASRRYGRPLPANGTNGGPKPAAGATVDGNGRTAHDAPTARILPAPTARAAHDDWYLDVEPALEAAAASPANGSGAAADSPAAADPLEAPDAYEQLVAKLRDGMFEYVPAPPPSRRWPWQRRSAVPSYATRAERDDAKRAAKAQRDELRKAKEAADRVAKAERAEAKRRDRLERAEAKRVAKAENAARRAADHVAKLEAKSARDAQQALAKRTKDAERAAAATARAEQKAADAAAKVQAKAATAAAKAEAKLAKEIARAEATLARDAQRAETKASWLLMRAAEDQAKEAKRAAADEAKGVPRDRTVKPKGFRGRVQALTSWESGGGKKAVAGGGSWKERNLSSLSKVKRIELIIFSRQMATFIRAGIPITDGIRVVREQTRSSLFRRTLDEVSALLESGEPLSGALAQHPRVFSDLYIDMVVAAEATGELDAILDQLAKYLERSDATARQMKQAMLYPTIVLGLAAIVVFILMVVVLPSFVALFADFDAVLPLPTQILLGLGAFGGKYGIITGGVVVMLLTLLFFARNTGPLKRFRQRLMLRLPVLGTIVKLGIETRFSRTLSILHKAGVPITQSFEIAANGTGNYIFQRRLGPVREALIAGEGISTPLANSKLFGPLLVQMVKVGEETGTLDRYLEEAAQFLDEELSYRTKQMVTIIEPLMILGVAGVVGFVALSVITPMYSILNQIK